MPTMRGKACVIQYPFEHIRKADALLEEVHETCERLKITFWLVLGTVLGFYREGAYIINDHDIDIGVKWKDFKRLVSALKRQGFVMVHYTKKNMMLMKDRMLLDIFIFDCKESEFIVYNNKQYRISKPVKSYLTKRYGNWQIPRLSEKKDIVVCINESGRYIFFNLKMQDKLIDGQYYDFSY